MTTNLHRLTVGFAAIATGILLANTAFASPPTLTVISGIADYKFNPDPQEPAPKMYNWEVMLDAADSTNGVYEIVQTTTSIKIEEAKVSDASMKVLIGLSPMTHTETICQNKNGIIHFNLHIGDKEAAQNMNGKGKIGQPVIFSGIGTGKGSSTWVVLPGSKVNQTIPSNKGTKLVDGKLNLIRYVVTDDSGEKFQVDVMLCRKSSE